MCGHAVGVRSFRMSARRFTEDHPHEVRFVRKAHRIVFLLTSQQSPFPDQAKQ